MCGAALWGLVGQERGRCSCDISRGHLHKLIQMVGGVGDGTGVGASGLGTGLCEWAQRCHLHKLRQLVVCLEPREQPAELVIVLVLRQTVLPLRGGGRGGEGHFRNGEEGWGAARSNNLGQAHRAACAGRGWVGERSDPRSLALRFARPLMPPTRGPR